MSLHDSFCQKKIEQIFFKLKETHNYVDKLLVNNLLLGYSQGELDEKWQSLPKKTREEFREVINELDDAQETYSLLVGDLLSSRNQIVNDFDSLLEESSEE